MKTSINEKKAKNAVEKRRVELMIRSAQKMMEESQKKAEEKHSELQTSVETMNRRVYMETYFEQGISRKDCELKITEKYKKAFRILNEKEVMVPCGFSGLFSKPAVEVEFYFLEDDRSPVKEIKEKIETGRKKEEHPAFVRAAELLRANDFSEKYIKTMLEKLRKELPLETLDDLDAVQNRLLEWIGESISIYKEDEKQRKPRIMILVGPTGVGKTTAIAKLAAIYGIGTDEIPAMQVRMITINASRICAKEQLESIGNIMGIPVSCVDDKQSLREEIAIHSKDSDFILVDTIGINPKASFKLGGMKEILDGAGREAEFHLVISAGTKTSGIEDIMRQFEPFNFRSVVLTKIDEIDRIGNVISALAEKRKSISYITDGQSVPGDIRRASVVHLLTNLDFKEV